MSLFADYRHRAEGVEALRRPAWTAAGHDNKIRRRSHQIVVRRATLAAAARGRPLGLDALLPISRSTVISRSSPGMMIGDATRHHGFEDTAGNGGQRAPTGGPVSGKSVKWLVRRRAREVQIPPRRPSTCARRASQVDSAGHSVVPWHHGGTLPWAAVSARRHSALRHRVRCGAATTSSASCKPQE
jgi:hypothetical protein